MNGKKLIVILFVSLSLAGCNLWDNPWDEYADPVFSNIPALGLTSPQEVMIWTADNIRYVSDDGHYFQSPGQTYDLGTGDCEDFTALAMYLLKSELWINSRMVNGYVNGAGHAWVSIDGIWMEPITGGSAQRYAEIYPEIEYWTYSQTMWRAISLKRSVM